jgi:short subunit dehydrogenase-like uncharacterized protein
VNAQSPAPRRIVLFGAAGYTGALTAQAMLERGLRPVLAGRNRRQLEELAGRLGGLEVAIADATDPVSVRQLLDSDDVMVTTVGPFVRLGGAAALACAAAGAHYMDSTGEAPFMRDVFERYGPLGADSGSAMLTAFGYDCVAGNLAGALALRAAGDQAVRVDTAYFMSGPGGRPVLSSGTRASLLAIAATPSFAFRDGKVQTERAARRYRRFNIAGYRRPAISIGASEHFGLPRIAPWLNEVNVYLGWFGAASRAMQALSLGSPALRLPGLTRLWDSFARRIAPGSAGGPDGQARGNSRSYIVGVASNAFGRELARAELTGVNGYTFTSNILAWGAERLASDAVEGRGALGPIEAFGLESLEVACAEAGLTAKVAEAAGQGGA